MPSRRQYRSDIPPTHPTGTHHDIGGLGARPGTSRAGPAGCREGGAKGSASGPSFRLFPTAPPPPPRPTGTSPPSACALLGSPTCARPDRLSPRARVRLGPRAKSAASPNRGAVHRGRHARHPTRLPVDAVVGCTAAGERSRLSPPASTPARAQPPPLLTPLPRPPTSSPSSGRLPGVVGHPLTRLRCPRHPPSPTPPPLRRLGCPPPPPLFSCIHG